MLAKRESLGLTGLVSGGSLLPKQSSISTWLMCAPTQNSLVGRRVETHSSQMQLFCKNESQALDIPSRVDEIDPTGDWSVACLRVLEDCLGMRALSHRLIVCLLVLPFSLLAVGGRGWHVLFPHAGNCCHSPVALSRHATLCEHDRGSRGACCGQSTRSSAGRPEPIRLKSLHKHAACALCEFFAQAQPLPDAALPQREVLRFEASRGPCVLVVDCDSPLGFRSRAPPRLPAGV